MILIDTYSILTITSLPVRISPFKEYISERKKGVFPSFCIFEVKGRHLTEPELIQISRYRD